MKKIIPFIFVVIFSTLLFAQKSPPSQEIPSSMVRFLAEIETLQPFMVSQKRFAASENQFNIQTRLNTLAQISTELKHEQRLDTPFFGAITKLLPRHMLELKEAFQAGHKEYARDLLNATLDGCSSCHSQVSAKNSHLWKFSPDTVDGTTFEKAEFLFAVRQYDEALTLYRKVVDDFKPNKIEPVTQDVQDALHKKLNILVRSKMDLKAARKEIERDLGKPELPEPVKVLLRSNLESITQLQKIFMPNVATAKTKEIETFAATVLGRTSDTGWFGQKNVVPQLFVSAILYQFVQTHSAKDLSPSIYYWLAKCENRISKNYFPLSELYLRECVERYPLSYEAKLCFNELESLNMDDLAKKPRNQ
jgi:hypothetical protein